MILAILLGIVAVAALVGTFRETALDGYRRVPTRPELMIR